MRTPGTAASSICSRAGAAGVAAAAAGGHRQLGRRWPWLRETRQRSAGNQASSDIFLGWQHAEAGLDGRSRDSYVRQLRDWKLSADIQAMVPRGMQLYSQLCGWTLARAHARSGDRIAIAAYLGGSDVFDQAIAQFASAYADQNERDYTSLADAEAAGRITAERDR